MDEADTDDSTPVPDRQAEPGQVALPLSRAVSKAPAPVRSISGGSGYMPAKPPEPSFEFLPPTPTGFVAFAHIPSVLAENAEAWRIPPEPLPDPADLRACARMIEAPLAMGEGQAAGIDSYSGKMLWIPADTWRTTSMLKRKQESAAFVALNGEPIRCPIPVWPGSFNAYPILSYRGLALMFGAETLPDEPPQSVLVGILEAQSRRPETLLPKAGTSTPFGKKPIPTPALLRWWEAYVKEHCNPDRRPTVNEQRAAAIAEFPVYASPTEITMQRLRALPITPPEWRESGRRPKSS